MVFALLPFVAAVLSLLLAVASAIRTRRSLATWCFAAGMTILAIDSLCTGRSLRATSLPEVLQWLTWGMVAKAFLPGVWLCFSQVYSRGDSREALGHWTLPLTMLALTPIGLVAAGGGRLLEFAAPGQGGDMLQLRSGSLTRSLNAVLLLAFALCLMNLEQTFRAAVGTMRWRIKYVVLGLAVIFSAQIYVRAQAILYSVHDPTLAGVESSALLIGCLFLTLAYARTGLAEIDVYPSRAIVRSSITILTVGGYLFVVGILAQLARRFGGAESFQFQVFVVLLGMSGLAVLLLSDRLRQRIQGFVGRHFSKAQHDSVRTWTEHSRLLAAVQDQPGLSAATARLISATFDVLSVSVWLVDAQGEQLLPSAATVPQAREPGGGRTSPSQAALVATGLRERTSPFDLDGLDEPWAEHLRQLNPPTFVQGGRRWCVPLRSADHVLGAIVLADRVSGVPYTREDLELLQCIAAQTASALENLRLAEEVAHARELEAFRTMSAFFVHDLKNATASLNLTLKNLPVHFDDPAFRADALRGLGNTAARIDGLIARLSALRQRSDVVRRPADLNQIVRDAVGTLEPQPDLEVALALGAVPAVLADPEQLRSVVTNLLLNARDASNAVGRIDVHTEHRGARVVLSVTDTGCGMSPAFLRDSLFKPFQSTKPKGLGIGMFQSRMVVRAHGGSMHVESKVGTGTTIRVSLPAFDGEAAR